MPYVTSAERFGIEKGRQEGRQEGGQEGELLLLTRLITLKFGELPDWARERLEGATTDQLEAWAERILSVESLEALLKE